MRTAYTTLVLSSGGVRGVAIAGAVERLEVAGLLRHVTTFIGTSAGSIIAMLLALGYSAKEVVQFAVRVDVWKTLAAAISLAELMSVHRRLGIIDSREKMKQILSIMIARSRVAKDKPDITFAEAFRRTGMKLVVCATNLATSEAVYFDERRSPNMPIEKAIRASCAIPFVFMPVDNKFVDGAMTVPYPVIATTDGASRTLGVCIIDSCPSPSGYSKSHILDRLVKYGYAIVRTIEKTQLGYVPDEFKRHTIRIECARGQILGSNILETMRSIGEEAGNRFLRQSARRTSNVLDTVGKGAIGLIEQSLRAKRARFLSTVSEVSTTAIGDK